MDRSIVATAVVVVGCTLAGFILTVFIFHSANPITAGLLGTGGGAMIGSFIAAIATNEPLLGGRTDMEAKRGPSSRRPPPPEDGRDPSKAL
ncbi:MAG: hypothetical protein U0360_11380 [Dehalococcoidia bacterium]